MVLVKLLSSDTDNNEFTEKLPRARLGFPSGSVVKNLPAMQESQRTWIWSLGQENPLEEEMETHSSNFAWKIPWTEEPGRLWSMESQMVGYDWSDWACKHMHQVRSEVFICIESFDFNSNLVKDEELLQEVQGDTGWKWQI